jgi:hypothetical protein
MKNLFLILFVVWEFEVGNCWFTFRDVLEVQDTINGVWREIPGPYTVVNGNNVVEVGGTSAQFYRVRRSYGTPNI